jgi:hypothetical protein
MGAPFLDTPFLSGLIQQVKVISGELWHYLLALNTNPKSTISDTYNFFRPKNNG